MSITRQDASSNNVPLTAIASLVATAALLVLLPAFIAVPLAVARAICCSTGAPAFTAGARDSCWHIVGSNKKAPRKRGCDLSPIGYIYDLSPVAITMGLPMVMAKSAIDEFVNVFIQLNTWFYNCTHSLLMFIGEHCGI